MWELAVAQDDMTSEGKGGSGKIAELFCQLRPRLFRAACLTLGDVEEAEALVQDTFARALEAWPRFKRRSSASTWLYGILLRLARQRRRRRASQLPAEELMALPSREASPFQQAESGEQTQALKECLQELPEEQTEALVLFYLESMRYREIAEALGVPIGTVKSRLHAAKRALAEALRKRGIEP